MPQVLYKAVHSRREPWPLQEEAKSPPKLMSFVLLVCIESLHTRESFSLPLIVCLATFCGGLSPVIAHWRAIPLLCRSSI
eukprot:m.479789 g.479789  ORF g.479789 m.479789 type:complete len:80 (+) comp21606_c0_seq1:4915-5154(+)